MCASTTVQTTTLQKVKTTSDRETPGSNSNRAATAAASSSTSCCGNQNNDTNNKKNGNSNKRRREQQSQLQQQRTKAIVSMAVSSSLHFAGYEFARSSMMALFTSSKTGFVNPAALPFNVVCVTPFSYFLLKKYTQRLQRDGPRRTLFYSTIAFAILLGLGAFIIQILERNLTTSSSSGSYEEGNSRIIILTKTALQATIFLLQVCGSGFVQLLTTAHWSFLGSVCGKDGVIWFAPIAGIGSVTSTLAAMLVSPLVDHVGLSGLLWVAAIIIVASCIASDDAYRIADEYLEPVATEEGKPQQRRNGAEPMSSCKKRSPPDSLLKTSHQLFQRVPVLASLCPEVLTCQCVSALINFLFVIKLKECIQDDEQRARWMGTCYAWINAASGFLQFAVLPFLVKRCGDHCNAKMLWLVMPCALMVCTSLMTYQNEITLEMVAASFALFKALEYSVRSFTLEMVFVSLDYESRYVGKEIINLFVNRFGKSAMAVAIFLAANLPDQVFVQTLSVSTCLWCYVSYPLTQRKQKVD